MAQFAGGKLRLARKAANGSIRGSPSGEHDYTIADNVATPRWAVNHPGATQADEGEVWDELIHGAQDEYLAVQFYHTAAMTTLDSSACTVVVPIKRITRGPDGRKRSENDALRLGDRMTKSTSGTINDPRGRNDDVVNVAEEWTDIFRLAIRKSENVRVSGFVQIIVDGT